MTIFVDASALVAMIALEPEAAALADRLDAHRDRRTSPIALWEASLALARIDAVSPDAAGEMLRLFTAARGIAVVPVDEAAGRLALSAHGRYGRGRHGARLNMGDCFAYACARAAGADLLYKGDDFSRTDMA